MENDVAGVKQKIKRELSDFLGVGMEDVEDESVLAEDLHMDASSMADFMEILSKAGFDTESLDLTAIETFEDLVEALTAHI